MMMMTMTTAILHYPKSFVFQTASRLHTQASLPGGLLTQRWGLTWLAQCANTQASHYIIFLERETHQNSRTLAEYFPFSEFTKYNRSIQKVLKTYEIHISLTGSNDNFKSHMQKLSSKWGLKVRQICWVTRTSYLSLILLLGEYLFNSARFSGFSGQICLFQENEGQA